MANRRVGKVGDSERQSPADNKVHSLLDDKANQAGLLVADKFQSQVLMSAMVAIQSGYIGQQTLQLLEQLGGKEFDPLSQWGQLPSIQELPLLVESSG